MVEAAIIPYLLPISIHGAISGIPPVSPPLFGGGSTCRSTRCGMANSKKYLKIPIEQRITLNSHAALTVEIGADICSNSNHIDVLYTTIAINMLNFDMKLVFANAV